MFATKTPILRAARRAIQGSVGVVGARGDDARIRDVHVAPEEVHVGFTGSQNVADPVRLSVSEHDGQHVGFAVGVDYGFVLLSRLAAGVLDVASPGRYFASGRTTGFMYLICRRSTSGGNRIGTPGALLG